MTHDVSSGTLSLHSLSYRRVAQTADLIHGSLQRINCDPRIKFLLQLFGSVWNVYQCEVVMSTWRFFTFCGPRPKSLCKMPPSYWHSDCTWIQTEDTYITYSRLFSLAVNSVIINYRQNNIVICVGSHFVLNGSFRLKQSVALTFGVLQLETYLCSLHARVLFCTCTKTPLLNVLLFLKVGLKKQNNVLVDSKIHSNTPVCR